MTPNQPSSGTNADVCLPSTRELPVVVLVVMPMCMVLYTQAFKGYYYDTHNPPIMLFFVLRPHPAPSMTIKQHGVTLPRTANKTQKTSCLFLLKTWIYIWISGVYVIRKYVCIADCSLQRNNSYPTYTYLRITHTPDTLEYTDPDSAQGA